MARGDKIEQKDEIGGFRGVQRKTNRFQALPGDLWTTTNVRTDEIGSLNKALGYTQRGSDLTSTSSTSTSTSTTTTSTTTS